MTEKEGTETRLSGGVDYVAEAAEWKASWEACANELLEARKQCAVFEAKAKAKAADEMAKAIERWQLCPCPKCEDGNPCQEVIFGLTLSTAAYASANRGE